MQLFLSILGLSDELYFFYNMYALMFSCYNNE